MIDEGNLILYLVTKDNGYDKSKVPWSFIWAPLDKKRIMSYTEEPQISIPPALERKIIGSLLSSKFGKEPIKGVSQDS